MSAVMEYKLQASWSIKKETFINAREKMETEKFQTTLPEVEYSIIMLPPTAEKEYCAFWIDTYDDDQHIKEIKLFIPSASFEGDLSAKTVIDPDTGTECVRTVYIKRKDILNPKKKLFVNDILTIEIRGILRSDKDDTKFDVRNYLWWDDNSKDFTFIVGNDQIKIHKLFLQQCSEVLPNNSNEIRIENFDKNVVTHVVRICYGHQPANYYTHKPDQIKHLFKIIEFTNIYEMPLIKEKAEFHLIEYIESENVCEFANKSVEFNADKLRGLCVNFISNCIKIGKPFNGFSDLKAEIVSEVFKSSVCHSQIS